MTLFTAIKMSRPVQCAKSRVSAFIARRSFLTFHWTYFLAICTVFSLIFWLSSHGSVAYIDSLFMVISAMSLTGMNTVNLSDLNMAQQVELYVLMILGSPILVSIVVLYVRKRAFNQLETPSKGSIITILNYPLQVGLLG